MKEFDYDMINRYLDGEMNAEEMNAFEEQMKQDAELRNETELLKNVTATLKRKLHPGETEKALRNSLTELNTEYFSDANEKAKVIPLNRRRWMTAVAAVFIMALLLTVWQPWKKEDLYTQYASLQIPGIAERGKATDSILKQAVENFNSKKFAEAIPFFETVLKDSGQNSFAEFYYAVALLQNNDIEKARGRFTGLYNGESLFKYDAAFFMALSHLKEKDKSRCIDWLSRIPADAANYSKARELLKKL